jgi:hypothetical protein
LLGVHGGYEFQGWLAPLGPVRLRWALVRPLLPLLVLLAVAGCLTPEPSKDAVFACSVGGACPDGFVCTQGFCFTAPDAGPPPSREDVDGADAGLDGGCVPRTCADLPRSCGAPTDGCGGTLSCGACVAPEVCGGGGVPNECGTPPACATVGRCDRADAGS